MKAEEFIDEAQYELPLVYIIIGCGPDYDE